MVLLDVLHGPLDLNARARHGSDRELRVLVLVPVVADGVDVDVLGTDGRRHDARDTGEVRGLEHDVVGHLQIAQRPELEPVRRRSGQRPLAVAREKDDVRYDRAAGLERAGPLPDLHDLPGVASDDTYRVGRAVDLGEQVGPLHDHVDRPGIVYILQGTITDHRNGIATDYGPGVGWPEDRNTLHWLENRGAAPAVEVSVDIVRQT